MKTKEILKLENEIRSLSLKLETKRRTLEMAKRYLLKVEKVLKGKPLRTDNGKRRGSYKHKGGKKLKWITKRN